MQNDDHDIWKQMEEDDRAVERLRATISHSLLVGFLLMLGVFAVKSMFG